MMSQMGQKKPKKSTLPNLLDDNNGTHTGKLVVNKFYHVYYLIRKYVKNTAWFFSCIGFMYLLPMGVEYMNEQNKIMMKIQMSMVSGGEGAPPL